MAGNKHKKDLMIFKLKRLFHDFCFIVILLAFVFLMGYTVYVSATHIDTTKARLDLMFWTDPVMWASAAVFILAALGYVTTDERPWSL